MRIKQPTKLSLGVQIVLMLGACLAVLLVAAFFLREDPFLAMQADSLAHAGTWEDDPKNWYRAFHEEPPAEIKVVHSKYWRSTHFTYEFIYYFEVEATPEWREKFLAKGKLGRVSPPKARSFRTNTHGDGIPAWFAPDPVEQYEVWDKDGYGSVWINQTNGHIFFYDMQL